MQPTPNHPCPALDNTRTMDSALFLTDEQIASAAGLGGYPLPAPPHYLPVPPPAPIVGLDDAVSCDLVCLAVESSALIIPWASLPLPQPQAEPAPVSYQPLEGPSEYDADDLVSCEAAETDATCKLGRRRDSDGDVDLRPAPAAV